MMAIGQTEAEAQRYAEDIGAGGPFVGTPEQIAAKMVEFVEVGVDYFMLRIAGLPNPDVASLITEELMPKIKTLLSGKE